MKQNETEELQSRREFFKKAAKAALPVVGAVVIASLPIEQLAASGCKGAPCAGTCAGKCDGYCHNSCYSSCYGKYAK